MMLPRSRARNVPVLRDFSLRRTTISYVWVSEVSTDRVFLEDTDSLPWWFYTFQTLNWRIWGFDLSHLFLEDEEDTDSLPWWFLHISNLELKNLRFRLESSVSRGWGGYRFSSLVIFKHFKPWIEEFEVSTWVICFSRMRRIQILFPSHIQAFQTLNWRIWGFDLSHLFLEDEEDTDSLPAWFKSRRICRFPARLWLDESAGCWVAPAVPDQTLIYLFRSCSKTAMGKRRLCNCNGIPGCTSPNNHGTCFQHLATNDASVSWL